MRAKVKTPCGTVATGSECVCVISFLSTTTTGSLAINSSQRKEITNTFTIVINYQNRQNLI